MNSVLILWVEFNCLKQIDKSLTIQEDNHKLSSSSSRSYRL